MEPAGRGQHDLQPEKEEESVPFWGCYQLISVHPQADLAGREVEEEL